MSVTKTVGGGAGVGGTPGGTSLLDQVMQGSPSRPANTSGKKAGSAQGKPARAGAGANKSQPTMRNQPRTQTNGARGEDGARLARTDQGLSRSPHQSVRLAANGDSPRDRGIDLDKYAPPEPEIGGFLPGRGSPGVERSPQTPDKPNPKTVSPQDRAIQTMEKALREMDQQNIKTGGFR